MTRREALWKVQGAVSKFGMESDEYYISDQANGNCPQAVVIVRALEALGLIAFDDEQKAD